MLHIFHEPSTMEIQLTLGLGYSILRPYYRKFARKLNLHGNEKVLDFGSGSGVLSHHISSNLQRGGHLDCVDISHRWQTIIRKTLSRNKNISFFEGHISQLDLIDSSYDVILIHFVFHDIPIPERQDILYHLQRVLKPSGRIMMREPRGHGLEKNELMMMAESVGLQVQSIILKNITFIKIYDGCFTKQLREIG